MALCCGVAHAQLPAFDATKRPTCTDGRPWSVWLLNETSSTDCDGTAGGTDEALCCCSGGVVAACASGAISEFEVSPYGQYSPDRPPASFGTDGFREEWTGNTAVQTWTWGNQDSASRTVEFDSEILQGDSTNEEMRFRWVAASASNPAQQVWTLKLLYSNPSATATSGCAIGALVAGTTSSPTEVEWLVFTDASPDTIGFGSDTNYDISAGFSLHGSSNTAWSIDNYSSAPSWLQLRYEDSSSFLSAYLSWDGFTWTTIGTSSAISGDPLYWGYGVRDFANCRAYYAQLRTDGSAEWVGE